MRKLKLTNPETLYLQARKPTFEELNGHWKVLAHGLVRPSNLFGDHKTINDGQGSNQLFDRLQWGFFTIKQGDDYLVLDYDHPRNHPLLRPIKDRVRLVAPGRFIGRFYYGEKAFFWFSLIAAEGRSR
ncbi:MAG: hypothetical protein OEV64_04155 [Desulfobulbaceae bacterium]|nr:hypothetical protein [Desulfobulbaceae bacterium]